MDFFRRLFGQAENAENPVKTPSVTPAAVSSAPDSEASATPEPEGDAVGIDTVPVQPLHDSPDIQRVLDGATRPLPASEKQPQPSGRTNTNFQDHLVFAQVTDVGSVRSNNQDSALSVFIASNSSESHPDFGLFIVADGMGGHHDGEKASAITTRVVAEQVTKAVYLPILAGGSDAMGSTPLTEVLVSAVQKANAEVITQVPDGGTTLTAVAIVNDIAYIAHVGDSRAYLITSEGIEQITRDHSLVQRLIELDQLTRSEADAHPQKNVLYRALGQNESLEVDTLTRRLPAGASIILCSDGLWSLIPDKEIMDVIKSHEDPYEACKNLIDLANKRGGMDNITAVVLRLPG
jgi:PPM family protein phosphatase